MRSREAVLRAIEECDLLGPGVFRDRYRFGRRTKFDLVFEGRAYDPKAIIGVAHGYEYPDEGQLTAADFSGGTSQMGSCVNWALRSLARSRARAWADRGTRTGRGTS